MHYKTRGLCQATTFAHSYTISASGYLEPEWGYHTLLHLYFSLQAFYKAIQNHKDEKIEFPLCRRNTMHLSCIAKVNNATILRPNPLDRFCRSYTHLTLSQEYCKLYYQNNKPNTTYLHRQWRN